MKKIAIVAVILGAILIGDSERVANSQDKGGPGTTAASVVMIDPRTNIVYIDWRLVELTSKGQGPAAEQPILVTVAKILLAVRDHKWQPMPK